MTLSEFLLLHDTPNAIVLLEGKRSVKPEDQPNLFQLGKLLASKTKHMKFRSGNAAGADDQFSLGVAEIDYTRLQVVTPYTGHRKKANVAYETISLDDISLASDSEIVYHSKVDKKTAGLIDHYISGDRGRGGMKAAYLIRDTVKVVGTSETGPATFGIFYDDLENPRTGGTGHTMKVCEELNVPMINQEVWFKWLE